MQVDPVAIAESHGVKLKPEQKEFTTRMLYALSRQEPTIFVGQGPPGAGKSLCIAPVTAALEKLQRRVIIATPTYMHMEQVLLPHLDLLGVDYQPLRGVTRQEEGCPLKGGLFPTSLYCRAHADECAEISCAIKRERERALIAPVVVTVFQKLLAEPRWIDSFQVAIFDESHGLEDAVRGARRSVLNPYALENLEFSTFDIRGPVNSLQQDIRRLMGAGLEEVPMVYVERFQGYCSEIEEQMKAEMNERELNNELIPDEMVNSYYEVAGAIQGFKHSADFRYAVHRSTIVVIPNEVTFAPYYDKRIGRNTSIALISATIENPRLHSRDAGFPGRNLSPPAIMEASTELLKRFNRRPIIGLVDGPVLRLNPHQRSEYTAARTLANSIICDTLNAIRVISLILCRNKEDAWSVEESIRRDSNLSQRVYVVPDNVSPSEMQNRIDQAVASGKDVVLTSASNRFWEGVNINGLRLVLIDSLPYPSPEPLERRVFTRWRTSRIFRFMIRRLQQGIGRLVRWEKEWGIVLVVDGRFNAQWRTIRSALPNYMYNVSFIPRSNITERLRSEAKRFGS